MYHTILFDLDGTLTDPGVGITNSVAHALSYWNISIEDRSVLYPFIGPPLAASFAEFYGFTPEECTEAIDRYREYYRVKGLYENVLYPGIPGLLQALKLSGKKLLLATSKPEQFARQILEHFHIDSFFDIIAGATMDEKKVEKPDIIADALDRARITDVHNVVMVGDRKFDVLGAKAFGMDSIGVTYGYGDYEELQQAGATYIADTVEDILSLV